MKQPPFSRVTGILVLAVVGALSGCSDKPAPTPVAAAAPAVPAAAAVPAPPAAVGVPAPAIALPAGVAGPASQPPVSTAVPVAPRQVPLNAQGVANAGLTVRVKNIELGEDATVLTVSASFGNRSTNFTNLAETTTFLVDAAGNRLMLRAPEDNRYVRINSGDTMEGKLVFLGAVPPTATQIRFVINDGNASDDTSGPGLSITLPLQQGGS